MAIHFIPDEEKEQQVSTAAAPTIHFIPDEGPLSRKDLTNLGYAGTTSLKQRRDATNMLRRQAEERSAIKAMAQKSAEAPGGVIPEEYKSIPEQFVDPQTLERLKAPKTHEESFQTTVNFIQHQPQYTPEQKKTLIADEVKKYRKFRAGEQVEQVQAEFEQAKTQEELGGKFWAKTYRRGQRGMMNVASGALDLASQVTKVATLGNYGDTPGEWARLYHDALKAPEFRPLEENVFDKYWGAAAETAPFMITAATGAIASGGAAVPSFVGSFLVSYAVEGNSAYQAAKDRGASEKEARTRGVVVGLVNAGIEVGLGGGGKYFDKGKVIAKTLSKMKRGKRFGKRLLVNALTEGLEEGLQETSAIALGGDAPKNADGTIDYKAAASRIVDSWLVGTILGAGFHAIGGGYEASRGAVPQRKTGPQTDVGEKPIPPITDIFKGRTGETAQDQAPGAAVVPTSLAVPPGQAAPTIPATAEVKPAAQTTSEAVLGAIKAKLDAAYNKRDIAEFERIIKEELAPQKSSFEKNSTQGFAEVLLADMKEGLAPPITTPEITEGGTALAKPEQAKPEKAPGFAVAREEAGGVQTTARGDLAQQPPTGATVEAVQGQVEPQPAKTRTELNEEAKKLGIPFRGRTSEAVQREIDATRRKTGGFLSIPWELPSPAELREGAEKIYQNYVNRFASIQNVTKKAKSLGLEIKAGRNPTFLARSYLGIGRKAESMLQKETTRQTAEGKIVVTGEGLKPILDSYDESAKVVEGKRSEREKDLDDYLISTRTVLDLQRKADEQAEGNIATPEQVKAAEKKLAALNKKYGKDITILRDTATRLYEFQKRILHLLVDAGNLSEKDFDNIVRLNKHYIPFDRVMEGYEGPPTRKGRFSKARAPIHKIKGSELDVQPPLESVIKNAYKIMDRADRNAVARSVAQLGKVLPEEISPIRVKMVPIRVDPKEIVTAVKEFRSATRRVMDDIRETTNEGGKDISGPVAKLEKVVKEALSHRGFSEAEAGAFISQIKKGKDTATPEAQRETIRQTIRETQKILITKEPLETTIFRPSQFTPKGNVIEYFDNGKRRYVEVPRNLYDAMTGLNEEGMGIVTKILSQPAHWLRVGATITPEFMLRNPIRDQYTACMQTGVGFIPFYDTIGGIASVLGKTESYRRWMQSGGAYSGFVELNRPALKKAVRELRGHKSLLSRLNVIGLMEDASQLFEQATRVAVFKKARGKGLSDIEAGFISRGGTVDFAVKGGKMKNVSACLTFFNAGIQGVDTTIRTFATNPVSATIKSVALITLPSLLLYLRNRDEDDWDQIPRWQRDLFWLVKIGENWWRIPKPILYGQVFGSMPERFFEYLDTEDPKAFDELAKSVYDSVSPASGDPVAGMIMTAAKPIIENIANWNFFLERPIVSEDRERLNPPEQFNRYTTESAKYVGKWLNYSPAKIENLIRGWFGGTGQYGIEGTDMIINAIKREEKGRRPREFSDMPLVKGFAVRPPLSQPADINNFYEERKKLTQNEATYKNFAKSDNEEKAESLLKQHPEIRASKHIERIAERLTRLQKEIVAIEESDKTDAKKRTEIEELQRERLLVAQEGLKTIEQTKK